MHPQRDHSFPRQLVVFLVGWIIVTLSIAAAAPARTDPSDTCDQAAHRAAERSAVPYDVLRAISRTETGRQRKTGFSPWPWTVNMEGRGIWFDTEDQAQAFVFRHFRAGARSFDIGCFQLNYKWHGHAFNSIEDMFDPDLNARYAAQFLTQLHQELGEWTKAAGAYHSRTAKYANPYLARYAEIHAALPAGTNTADIPAPRGNNFPFFRPVSRGSGNASPGNASLVPLGFGQARSIFTRQGGE
ncbi:MAG: hypothetical protein ACJAVM_001034 [Sulfitobacter sp.]|jgi:hypothetical protein